jgi:Trk K+ transport system NAD-binding subunit
MRKKLIYIFGTSHISLRLAENLSDENEVILFDSHQATPEEGQSWTYLYNDFSRLPDLSKGEIVYVVTNEDQLNIRLALSIGNSYPDLPVTISLSQSRLGIKLSGHIKNFSFINPSELAAKKFADAVNTPRYNLSNVISQSPSESVPEVRSQRQIDPLILRALLFSFLLAVITTIYFHYAENIAWIDSWYFVITLMTTVGFGDYSLREASSLSKIIGALLMIASVTNTAIIFALISDSLLKQRLSLTFGRKKLHEKDHVIVVGLGSVGLKVIEELLERGEKVALIETDINARFMPTILALRVPIIIGDAKLERTMQDVGLDNAKAVISVTSNDLTNLEIGLNVKSLNPGIRLVLRIYDQPLAQTLDKQLDIHFALSTSAIAAEELVSKFNTTH